MQKLSYSRLARDQHGLLLRHRVFVVSLVSFPIYLAFAANAFIAYQAPVPASTAAIAAAITFFSFLALFISSKDSLPGHLFTLALTAQVFGEMAVNGGMLAGATPMSVLIAPIAIFTAGRHAAWPWLVVAVLGLFILFYLDLQGFLPPNQFPPMAQRIDRVLSLAAGLMVMTLLIFKFDRQIESALSTLANERADYKHSALHDELTGLPNRRYFYEKSTALLDGATESGGMLMLLFIDINLFKQSDAVLKEFAARLQERAGDKCVVARLSGDEFAVIFKSIKDQLSLNRHVEQLKRIADEPIVWDGIELNTGLSMGSKSR